MQRAVIIMAGGRGSRLWPISRGERPKPLIPDFPRPGPSLLAATLSRVQGLVAPEQVYIVASPPYAAAIRAALPDFPPAQILIEAVPRNTAPGIAYALQQIRQRNAALQSAAVLPADHLVHDVAAFRAALSLAFASAEQKQTVVTLGILPSYPHTGYGYIHVATPKANPSEQPSRSSKAPQEETSLLRGRAFVEKPDLEQAKALCASGEYRWNAGIFVAHYDSWKAAYLRYAPQIWQALDPQQGPQDPKNRDEIDQARFMALPSIAVDRAIMEKLSDFWVVELDAGWMDLGTWPSVAQELCPDAQGNRQHQGPRASTWIDDSHNCSVWNEDAQIVLVGAKDLYVVASGNRVLIAGRDPTKALSQLADDLADELAHNLAHDLADERPKLGDPKDFEE